MKRGASRAARSQGAAARGRARVPAAAHGPHRLRNAGRKRQADIFLTYCTNAVLAKKEEPALEIVALPESLAVGAEYGLVVMKGASAGGERFATFLLTPARPGGAGAARLPPAVPEIMGG